MHKCTSILAVSCLGLMVCGAVRCACVCAWYVSTYSSKALKPPIRLCALCLSVKVKAVGCTVVYCLL